MFFFSEVAIDVCCIFVVSVDFFFSAFAATDHLMVPGVSLFNFVNIHVRGQQQTAYDKCEESAADIL